MRYIWKYKLDHVAFWLITVLFYSFIRRDLIDSAGWFFYLADVAVHNILLVAVCYTNIYFLFERYFRKDRYLIYGLSLLILLLLYSISQNGFDRWLSSKMNLNSRPFLYNTYYHFSIGFFYLAFTLSLELSKRWYKQKVLLQQMQTEKLKAELQYLKAQLNPHFLFNSINTIYFQIDKSNIEARESLQKFSELLRYQLYECNEDRIPIEKEISYLESYVDLQRLRKNSRYSILFKSNDSVKEFSIAPLLLIPFVENAFKHLSNHTNVNNTVELNMNRQNGSFLFSVTNSIETDKKKTTPPGIGLANVRRRLDLLYEDKYNLSIEKNEKTFCVELQIPIS
ncbi:MAG TPA: histidine kinase [Flavitalea sp.]|nr:histidine kinase [Flavitalea sp.]